MKSTIIKCMQLGILLNFCSLNANIKSASEQIKFDVSSDEVIEMSLNKTGLGIGTTTPSSKLDVQGNAIIHSQLNIGTKSFSNANLQINGSLAYSYLSINSDQVVGNTSVVLADTSSDNLVLTLPHSGNHIGQLLRVKKTSDKNTLWIKGNGGAIDQQVSIEVPTTGAYLPPSITFLSDGNKWNLVDAFNYSGNIPVTTDLFAWYDFNVTSGNSLEDLSPQGNDGTLINRSFTGDTGIAGNGIQLNGIDQYIQITAGDGSDFDLDASNFTISCWFKSTAEGRIFHTSNGNDADTSDNLGVRLESNGSIVFTWEPGGANDPYEVTGSYNDGQWHHVVGIRNGLRTGVTYVDGELAITDNDSSGTTSGINIFSDAFIGRSVLGNDYFNGTIDEVRLYDRVLSEDEIQLLYLNQ